MADNLEPNMARWIPLIFFTFLGIFLSIGAYTFHYAKGTSYLSNDPKACVNCHVMQEQYDSWIKSSHHQAATCNDCHIPHEFPFKYMAKMRNGWNHSKAFTLQNFPDAIRITRKNLTALQENCLHCHQALVSTITGHGNAGVQRCTECHRSVGHISLSN